MSPTARKVAVSYLPYAGIGSRKAPYKVCNLMGVIARQLEEMGFTLRSGGARGSDAAFEHGLYEPAKAEIFLPEQGYNGHASEQFDVDDAAINLARSFYPRWDKLSAFAQACHARNCYQVLGRDLESPSKFVVCWTPRGQDVGGTGQALRLARAYHVPVFNLFEHDATKRLTAHVREVLAA